MRPIALAIVVALAAAPLARAAERPNIVFIFTDDHATHAIGAYGSVINETPNLDRLAREGMRFDSCFCTNAICAPSRAVILTGKHSHRNGVPTNRESFDGGQQTFPKLLQSAGYETAIVGKWHLKSDPTGFDHWEVLLGQGPYYNPALKTENGTVQHEGYTTDVLTDRALEWLEEGRDREKPFVLMFQHKAPHRNWMPDPKHFHLYDGEDVPEPPTLFDDYSGRAPGAAEQQLSVARNMSGMYDLKLDLQFDHFNFGWERGYLDRLTDEQRAAWNAFYGPRNEAFRKRYEAGEIAGDDLVRFMYQRYIKDYLRVIASVDDNVGRVLDYLDAEGLAENTVVVYSSDQGFFLGDHGWYDKRWMYEESLRMPLIVRWPAGVEEGATQNELVQNLDFAPTFLELAGAAIPDDMQGRSLVPILQGDRVPDWRESIYYHYYEQPSEHNVPKHYGVRTERYKLIRYYEIDAWELFDLQEDPHELKSVYDDPAYADLRQELAAELTRLQEQYGDTDPTAPLGNTAQVRLREQAAKVPLEEVLRLDTASRHIHSHLDPTGMAVHVGAWVTPGPLDGVIAAHGGAVLGYALYLQDGQPCFAVRADGVLTEMRAPTKLKPGERVHVIGSLDHLGYAHVYVNGEHQGSVQASLLSKKPTEGFTPGRDISTMVGPYEVADFYDGAIEDFRLHFGVITVEDIARWIAGAPDDRPEDRMAWWREARFGLFLHWGLYSVPAGKWGESTGHAEWIRTTAQIPRETYAEFLPQFNPVDYDPDLWVRLAKRAGMKYVVITSKHHDGFCLYDSKETEWDVMSSPYGKDLLAPLAEACRRHGLKICWYHSIMDWHHPDYLPRRGWEDWSPEGADFERFRRYLHAQVTELLTNYGEIGVMWFDGEWERTWSHEFGQPLYDLCLELQPSVIVNNRVDVGRGGMAGMTTEGGYAGDFGTPEQEIPATGLSGVDWETCMTMNDHWGYNAADDHWKSNEDLIRKLIDIASKGGNFLLNVGPTAEGRFPEESIERLEAIGAWMDVNAESIHGTVAGRFEDLPWGRSTTRVESGRTTLYLHVFDWPMIRDVLRVPGLGTMPTRTRMLTANGDRLVVPRLVEGGVDIELNEFARFPYATVVALEFDTEPIIFRTPAIEAAAEVFVRPLEVSIDARSPGLELRYTLDGSTPQAGSPLYTAPLTLTESANLRVRAFHEGRAVSHVVARDFERVTPRPALADPAGLTPGLDLAIYEGDFDEMPRFDTIASAHREIVPNLALGLTREFIAHRYTGYVRVPADDAYAFHLTSDDGSRLLVGRELLIDNDGLHGPRTLTGVTPLAAGWHPIRIEWFNKTGGAVLELKLAPVGKEAVPIDPQRFGR